MNAILEWLWCSWHMICYKHGIPKEAGIGSMYCPSCRNEAYDRHKQRLERIQESRRNINSIAQ